MVTGLTMEDTVGSVLTLVTPEVTTVVDCFKMGLPVSAKVSESHLWLGGGVVLIGVRSIADVFGVGAGPWVC